jgi:ElaB/YqjD/DUF883 family membrane-anchored ribosome-binding protein
MTNADKAAGVKDEMSAAAEKIGDIAGEDFHKLREEVARMRGTIAHLTKSIGAEIGNEAKKLGGEARKLGAEFAHTVEDEASSLVHEFEKVARKNPVAVVAGALFLGILIGLSRGRH